MLIPEWEAVVRVALSVVLSSVIGAEREAHERPAGLRTHVLVGVGSCTFTLISLTMMKDGGDPGRIAAQVVTGIGFIGAGTIWMRGDIIRGLTTASSIWTTAAIGMAVAVGWYSLAIIATLLVFVSLTGLRFVERGILQRVVGQTVVLNCELPTDSEVFWNLLTTLGELRVRLLQAEPLPSGDTDFRRVRLTLRVSGRITISQLTQALTRTGAISVIQEK